MMHLLMSIKQKHIKYTLWSLSWSLSCSSWWSSVADGGRLRIVVVHHRRGLSWRYVLVVRVTVIRCGRVVLVRRHRHRPLLSTIAVDCASWSWLVVRCRPWGWPSHRGGTSLSVVIRRCPWSWLCSSIVCFVLVRRGHNPLSPSCSSLVVVVRLSEQGVGRTGRCTYLGSASAMPRVRWGYPSHPACSWCSPVRSCIGSTCAHCVSSWVVAGWLSVRWRRTTTVRCSSFGCHVAVGDVAAGLSVTMGMEGSV